MQGTKFKKKIKDFCFRVVVMKILLLIKLINFPQISRHTKHAFPQRVFVSYIGKEDF